MASRITNGKQKGFTLIELLVVMAIIATLMTLVAPKYFTQTERAKEVVLQHNIRGLREAIDHYRQDKATGPESLDDLVSSRYLKNVPIDPVTGNRDSWQTELDDDGQIKDVRSGATGMSLAGEEYAQW
ncbi:type II secretion system protein [Glaciimonas sp. GG7]